MDADPWPEATEPELLILAARVCRISGQNCISGPDRRAEDEAQWCFGHSRYREHLDGRIGGISSTTSSIVCKRLVSKMAVLQPLPRITAELFSLGCCARGGDSEGLEAKQSFPSSSAVTLELLSQGSAKMGEDQGTLWQSLVANRVVRTLDSALIVISSTSSLWRLQVL